MRHVDTSLSVRSAKVWELSAPLQTPRRNAFGEMRSRPALLIELTLNDGAVGWGEVFCNWPAFAAPHRARILTEILVPFVVGKEFESPSAMTKALTEGTRLLSLQSGEHGPFAQAIGGVDIAAWDAVACRADEPLYRVLAGERLEANPLYAYASALTGETMASHVPNLVDQGWRGFKIKIGFGRDHDLAALDGLKAMLGNEHAIMTDANQIWTPGEAAQMMERLKSYNLTWVEEPISSDASSSDWTALTSNTSVPIAAGENLRGIPAFAAAVQAGVKYLQPDPVKWSGLSGMADVAALTDNHNAHLAPHYLGAGVGLAATAHGARAFGATWMELDVTENRLRTDLIDMSFGVTDGRIEFTDAPGHGVMPPMEWLSAHAVTSHASG